MPTIDEVEPDEPEDDELPSSFLIFTNPNLDHDKHRACEAGAEIGYIQRDIIRRVCELEDIERALRKAEPTSARARRAREHLLSALSQTDGLVTGVGNAWDALTFHWDATTTPVPR